MHHLTIIGFGMMGASVAAAVKARLGSACRIQAIDPAVSALEYGQSQGWIDTANTELSALAPESELVILATPLGAMPAIFAELAHFWANTETLPLLQDLGSVKGRVISAAKKIFSERQLAHFIPGHPIAGSEKSGPQAGNPNLFEQRAFVLCPLPENAAADIARLTEFWQALGAQVVLLSAQTHDERLALTSHLPHAVVLAYLQQLHQQADFPAHLAVTGGGFDDFTRIGRLDSAVVWQGIFFQNKAAVCKALKQLQHRLSCLERVIEAEDAAGFQQFITPPPDPQSIKKR